MSGHFFLWGSMSKERKKKIARDLSEQFLNFITQHPPSEFSRRLRNLLLDYMMEQQKIGFPLDFHIHLWELYDLFALLDCAADEWEKQKES